MGEWSDFVGTWRAEKGAPFSTHTFTWENTGTGLRGRWIVDPAISGRSKGIACN